MLIAGVLISIGISAATGDVNSVTFGAKFLRTANLDAQDSWSRMILAIEHLRSSPETPVYQKIFFAEQEKFQYPISSLLLPDLIQRLSGRGWDAVIHLLNRLSWYSVWMTGFIAWRLFLGSHRRATGRLPDSAADEIRVLWPTLGLTILFYPLSKSHELGQIQTFMTLFSALALLLWRSGRKGVAGICIGLCCAIKPQWAVLILWGALRREWSMVAMAAGAAATLMLAAGALYGFRHHLDYLSVLSFLAQHGEAYFPNQSVNGLLNRLLYVGNNLHFDDHAFPDFHPAVYAGTVGAAVIMLGAALLFRRREKPRAIDLALVMLAATIASPIAWEHHYGILLPIFALMAPICLAASPFGDAVGRWGLLSIFLVASQRLDVANRLADTSFNVLQSYLFFAALAVLMLLFRLAGRSGEAAHSGTGQVGGGRARGVLSPAESGIAHNAGNDKIADYVPIPASAPARLMRGAGQHC